MSDLVERLGRARFLADPVGAAMIGYILLLTAMLVMLAAVFAAMIHVRRA